MSEFLKVIRDNDRGNAYRTYAGISMDNIPCEGTFSHFRIRLGEKLYNEIFHLLVDIFHQLEMITFNIIKAVLIFAISVPVLRLKMSSVR
jgi:hypothetical protein